MPVICIGPVCVPWTCIPAIVFFLWKFAKPLLPADWAASIEKQAAKLWEALAPYMEKVPFFGKKKGKCTKENGAAESVRPGEVGHLASAEQLQALLQRSKEGAFGVVLDFTASWCKPCQAIKPHFQALAGSYPGHVFLQVDADELEDVVTRSGVMGLPTFQVYVGGEQVGSITGADEAKLGTLISHLAAK
ncbi:TXN [Symbiodinium natans]|uniref:TXN protein n=1 Tax=Symbiodinium natans TaxID=878477 RepID=A0A812JSD9_9DINO|nr:TXN [Symbiodinium natans]